MLHYNLQLEELMKNINIIIDAVIDENNINSLGHRLNKSLPYIIHNQIEKKPDGSIDVYNSVCDTFKFTVENNDCENYPNIEKQFKIIMEAKKNAR